MVVVDHHQADEVLPPAVAIVNPNRRDDLSGLGHLAAVGLTFMTVVAANRELRQRGFWTSERPEPDLLTLLDDVALGTVADVVPLIGLNRAFVTKGLIALRRRERPGHVSLMDVARLSGPPEAWHLGFLLGPRINAGGRIGRADLGVRLLLEDDPVEAAQIAAELDRLNRERQVIEMDTLAQAEAEAMAALGIEEKGAVVVTAAEGWHPGVVGIVAARLKEKFGRPAFAIALEPGGIGTGSGRSIAGVDIGRAVRRAVTEGLLVKGGGHAMAAGVTLRKDALAPLRAFFEATLGADVEIARRANGLLIDGAVSAAAANAELVAMIERAGPFGSGNPEPVIALPAHTIAYAEEVARRTCGFGSNRPTVPASAPSPSAPPVKSSVLRSCKTAASRSTPPAHLPSIAFKVRSACNSALPTSHPQSLSLGGELTRAKLVTRRPTRETSYDDRFRFRFERSRSGRLTHLFLVPGGLVDPFLPALARHPGLTPIVATHEGGAAYMADGYARASGAFRRGDRHWRSRSLQHGDRRRRGEDRCLSGADVER